jgi:Cu(I)/Ag(I) efflux system membrane protein CusA/SilA
MPRRRSLPSRPSSRAAGQPPPSVEIVTTYDRSALIERAIRNLTTKLGESFWWWRWSALFLWHLRSALVAIIALPLGVMTAFLVMRYQGINANIMSLGALPSPWARWWMRPW